MKLTRYAALQQEVERRAREILHELGQRKVLDFSWGSDIIDRVDYVPATELATIFYTTDPDGKNEGQAHIDIPRGLFERPTKSKFKKFIEG